MSLTDAYLVSTKNVEDFFNAIQTAKAPERFTYKFLKDLGFTSSNDRLYVKLLKQLGFLDDNGVPTSRYYKFLDQSQSGAILAKAIEEAYEDLFLINKNAHEMDVNDVQNKLKTLTEGKKSEKVTRLMATTFKALTEYADWEGLDKLEESELKDEAEEPLDEFEEKPIDKYPKTSKLGAEFHYNIQIHLPESRDSAVYDAIFQSLKKHLTL